MKPRPLRRSITFWAGIFVMGFICWAWWDSMGYVSALRAGRYGASSVPGYVTVYGQGGFGPSAPQWERQEASSWRSTFASRSLPTPSFLKGGGTQGAIPEETGKHYAEWMEGFYQSRPAGSWIFLLPYWLVLLVVVAAWCGLLLWRARRIGRVAISTAP